MILLVDNYDSFTHNLYQQVVPLAKGYGVEVVRSDRISVEEVRALQPAAVIVSPGPSVPQRAGISIPLIQALASTVPIFGVCLGMQAMAVAFGAQVVRARAVVHGKASTIRHAGRGLFSGLPKSLEVGRYHSLVVSRLCLPKVLQVDAETVSGEIMAVSHRRYPCYGVQFHPESLLTPNGSALVQNFLIRLP